MDSADLSSKALVRPCLPTPDLELPGPPASCPGTHSTSFNLHPSVGHRAGGRTGSQLALGPRGTTLAALTGADVLDTPCGTRGGGLLKPAPGRRPPCTWKPLWSTQISGLL